ncbi:MAG: hypothetical protein ACYTEZ_14520 [Planctomycetota bacterium]|jgi:uncharacterized protein (TIGR03546 family)
MLFRKFGKLLLGKATPFHLVASCLAGAWLAFAPAFAEAPALWIVLVALICLLPVNLGLAAVTALVAYPLSLVLMPVSFTVGRILLDGPTRPLFAALINAPFTALMGFEYYAGTGGLLVGGLCGAAAGWGMTRLVRRIRRGFRDLDRDSARFHQWASKWWVLLGSWLLLGSRPKSATYDALERRRVGKPVRPVGIVVALLLVGAFLWLGHQLSGPILTRTLTAGLERVNGATVDLERAEIRLDQARVVIDQLAMADPQHLATDLLRGMRLEADLGVGALLRRRFHVDRLVISQATSGETRRTPGRLTGTEPTPQDVPAEGEKTLEDYLEDAQRWRERLAQARRWLDRLTGQPDPDGAPTEEERRRREENLEARLARWVREVGYARVTAEHLIEGAPRLSIGELRIEGLKAMQIDGKPFDVVGANLSTHPYLLDEAPRLSIRARDGTVVCELTLAGASRKGGENRIELAYRGLPGDAIGSRLKVSGTRPLRGGTIDFATKGRWQAEGPGTIDLPLTVVLKGTTLELPGTGRAQKIEHLELPLKVYGPLDDPRVLFREKDLAQALLNAGQKDLAKRLGERLPEGLGEKVGLLDKLRKPK